MHHFALLLLRVSCMNRPKYDKLIRSNLASERNNNTKVAFGIITCILFCSYIQFIETIVPELQL